MNKGYLQEVKAVIKSLILSCPQQISVDQLNKDFKATEGYTIPFRKLGYSNIDAFLHSIPDTVCVDGYGLSATVRSVRNKKTDHIQDMVQTQKNSRLPRRSASKKFQITQSFPDKRTSNMSLKNRCMYGEPKKCGFDDVPHCQESYTNTTTFTQNTLYQKRRTSVLLNIRKMANETSNPSKPIATNLRSNVQLMKGDSRTEPEHAKTDVPDPKDFVIKLSAQKKDEISISHQNRIPVCKKLLWINEPTEMVDELGREFQKNLSLKTHEHDALNADESNGAEKQDVSDSWDVAVPNLSINDLILQLDFPNNAVTYGTEIPYSTASNNVKVGDLLSIFITEVHNPCRFWFQMHVQSQQLDNLTFQMQNLYSDNEPGVFCLFPPCITPGQLCAAQYEKLWLRGEILSPVIDGKAKIFFFDYGTVSKIEARNIKFLHKDLLKIPRLAQRGCMSYISPCDAHWSLDSSKAFLKLAKDSGHWAQISYLDLNEQIFYMVLCTGDVNNVVQVNRELINAGYAFYDKLWLENHTGKGHERWQRDTFPTFAMLEAGEYPTNGDLWQMQEQGIDYEQIIDRSFFHPGRLNDCDNMPIEVRNLSFQLLSTNPFRGDIVMQLKELASYQH